MSALRPEKLPRLQCAPQGGLQVKPLMDSTRSMEWYAVFTLHDLWPESTEPDPDDLITWWCKACRLSFPPIDEVRPQRCPQCDAEAELGGLSFL